MFDLSCKFEEFYKSHVVLPRESKQELYRKKDLNLQRLQEGLKEYNEEHKTSYAVVETRVQGSVAMSTVVQNDEHDYDIDVAIVFDEANLGEKGALATRNILVDALRRKTSQFNAEPECKTSCIRVRYADGYHIDFAVYKRYGNDYSGQWTYEHAGSNWTLRELDGLNDWFENNNCDDKLRKVIRLSKMFCGSRVSWKNMPSGLLQTVVCAENLKSSYSRIDELFYYTMKAVVARLEQCLTVIAPIDQGRDLTPRAIDIKKMTNWKNRLKSKLEDLDILFEPDCTQKDAAQAWFGFFNHNYWQGIIENCKGLTHDSQFSFDDNEQFIEELYPTNLRYTCELDCQIDRSGWRRKSLKQWLYERFDRRLPQQLSITCSLKDTNCPQPYRVFWKVKNSGPEAERRNSLRGQILQRGQSISENSLFQGNHYIECYLIQNHECVARCRIEVPISKCKVE